MKNSLPTPGSPLEDEAFFLFHAPDSEEEINQQLGLANKEYVFFG